ncbi:MAG TPA: VirB3 family type IV secretion system protein [Candidatus Sulfotelmatobacter sp.]|nr:VirB3 family type IV secretion system protein [Candidatus Sulfotelmatobacter sp.]
MSTHVSGGPSDEADELRTERVVHASLVRPMLYAGVERHVIAMEGTICLALVFGVGLRFATLALVVVVVAVVHPVMAWVTAKEPQATEIYVRAHAYRDHYAPHAELNGAVRAPRPSLPRVR